MSKWTYRFFNKHCVVIFLVFSHFPIFMIITFISSNVSYISILCQYLMMLKYF